MSRWHSSALAVVLTALLASQSDSGRASVERAGSAIAPAAPAAGPTATTTDTLTLQPETAAASPPSDCNRRISAILEQPRLPGAATLDAGKSTLLLYAKAEPVHFTRQPSAAADLSRNARSYRSMLARTQSPWSLLQRLTSVFAANPELSRAVLLTDGYLYAEDPKLAFALVDLVSAQLLFNDQQLWIQRGERLLHAARTHTGRYVFRGGPEDGERVRLMLFDRIGAGELPTPLHRDFRALRQRLGFERARVVHETEHALVADLRYGAHWVRSLLEADGAHLTLGCELAGDHGPVLAAHRQKQAELARLLDPLRRAMRQQVDEGLPFDEPRTEYGQQDGQLRSQWQRAYLAGRSVFEFQDDHYNVFDISGRPRVPQVCVDFIYDTFERAGGTWWQERGAPPARVMGKLDLAALTTLNLRRASSIVDLARDRPEWFELYLLPETERVPFKYGAQLASYLTERADEFVPGDIVVIRGYAPWDKPWMPRVMHMHSFFVYESDPMTGMPIVLAGNPGQPVLQTWQFEAFRTPERSIYYRVRPRAEWLRTFIDPPSDLPAPPALTIDVHQPARPLDTPLPGAVPAP